MDKETQDILYGIPEGADVADASELDVEDIPLYHIQALIKFLENDTDNTSDEKGTDIFKFVLG